ncbi:MAG: histidine kinase [Rikenellaceae bacterium]
MIGLGKRRLLLINLMIALAISLVINFSYFFMWIQNSEVILQGVGGGRGSSSATEPVVSIAQIVLYQVVYYMIISYGLLLILFYDMDSENYRFWDRILLCTAISVIFYQLSPSSVRSNEIFTFQSRRAINPTQALKSFFLLVVASMYARLYKSNNDKQRIMLENEQLKNENTENRYDMLVSQFNPHFFFNSLNSLSMLVRTDNKVKALDYIDNLSDTFRYILKNGQQGLISLGKELSFMESYKYLHEIRYQDKLLIEINIDNSLYNKKLASMSLQPLIENAVKHNVISSDKKLVISIYVDDGYLCVSNPIRAKIEQASGMGIGLENMSLRYKLLINKDIEVVNQDEVFTVKLPLID